MKARCSLVSCLVIVALIMFGCAPAKAPTKTEVPAKFRAIQLVGGSIGSSTTVTTLVYAKILSKYYPEIEWSTRSGSTGTSPIYITNGTIQVAEFATSNWFEAYGWDKVGESRLRSLFMGSGPLELVWLIPEDKPWRDITEIPKGTSVCPGPQAGAVTTSAEIWVELSGLSKSYFNWLPGSVAEMTDAWRSGKIDALHRTISAPEAWLIDIFASPRRPKPFGLTEAHLAKAKAEKSFERRGFLTPGKSNLIGYAPQYFTYEVNSPKVGSMLFVRDDFPDEIAYKMAKVFDEHQAELAQIYGRFKHGGPQLHVQYGRPPFDIHPGVAKYYKEKGYLK